MSSFQKLEIKWPLGKIICCPEDKKKYSPQHTMLYPQHTILYPQHTILYPQHTMLYPQHTML